MINKMKKEKFLININNKERFVNKISDKFTLNGCFTVHGEKNIDVQILNEKIF